MENRTSQKVAKIGIVIVGLVFITTIVLVILALLSALD